MGRGALRERIKNCPWKAAKRLSMDKGIRAKGPARIPRNSSRAFLPFCSAHGLVVADAALPRAPSGRPRALASLLLPPAGFARRGPRAAHSAKQKVFFPTYMPPEKMARWGTLQSRPSAVPVRLRPKSRPCGAVGLRHAPAGAAPGGSLITSPVGEVARSAGRVRVAAGKGLRLAPHSLYSPPARPRRRVTGLRYPP